MSEEHKMELVDSEMLALLRKAAAEQHARIEQLERQLARLSQPAVMSEATRCPECNARMRVEIEVDPDQHVVTDKYWLCPECGRGESFHEEPPHAH